MYAFRMRSSTPYGGKLSSSFWLGRNSADGGLSIVEAGTNSLLRLIHRASSYTINFGTSEITARPPAMSPYSVQYPTASSDLFPVLNTIEPNLFESAIHLGPTEFRLLEFFMQHPRRVFSREELLDAVWGPDIHVEPRTVDVHIRRLRKSINAKDELDIVRTVRAAGYALDTEPV